MLQDTGGLSVEMLIKHSCEVAAFSTEGRAKKTCFLLSRHSEKYDRACPEMLAGLFPGQQLHSAIELSALLRRERFLFFIVHLCLRRLFFFHYLERNIGLASLKTPLPSFLLWGLGIQLHLTPTSQ